MSIRSCLLSTEERDGNLGHRACSPNRVTPGQDQALALGCDPPIRLDLGLKLPDHPGLAAGLNTADIVTAYKTTRWILPEGDCGGREHPNPSLEFHQCVRPACSGQH